jgi:hypothetical protein
MAVAYESEVTIERSPAEVFRYLVERDKQALWSDVEMKPVTEGELRTGSRFEVTFGMGPLKATLGLEMTTVEVGALMKWRTYSGPISWQGEYRLAPEGAGTRLSQQGTLEFHGLWRLLQPIVGGEIRSAEVKELEKLKAAAESGT